MLICLIVLGIYYKNQFRLPTPITKLKVIIYKMDTPTPSVNDHIVTIIKNND